jgi:hypothetical protein
MQDLSKYIQQLMTSNDCVVLPNFGAILGTEVSAEFSMLEKCIIPPSKRLSFNPSIQQNDGLLPTHIAFSEGISFEQAGSLMQTAIALINSRLINREIVHLKEIGRFRLDLDGCIQFEHVSELNFSAQSFGLPSLTMEPILREERKEEQIKEFVAHQEKPIHETLTVPVQAGDKESQWKISWKIAASTILVVGLAVGLLVWQNKFANKGSNFQGQRAYESTLAVHDSPNIPAKVAVQASAKASVANNQSEEFKSSIAENYTDYLKDAQQSYFLSFHTTNNVKEAKKVKNGYRKEGMDARIVEKEGVYHICLYYFVRASQIDSIQSELESETQLITTVISNN